MNTEVEIFVCDTDVDSLKNEREKERNSPEIIWGKIEDISLNVSQFIYLHYLIIYIQDIIGCYIFFYV